MSGKRRFVIEDANVKLPRGYKGLFESTSPYTAAVKAARSIFRKSKTKKSEVMFTLRECTQGSNKKEFNYTGTKTKLPQPIPRLDKKGQPLLDANGKPVVIKFKYSVKSA